MPERTYTEEEVAAIYARAAERRRSAATHDSSPGLTLAEVEQAGREAGLDPVSVRAAAAGLDVRHHSPTRSNVAVAERWIETPMNAGVWEDVVTSLRHQFGTTPVWLGGDTATLGEAQEWIHTAASGARTAVTLSPRQGRTRLQVTREHAGLGDDRMMGWLLAALLGIIPSILVGALVGETLSLGVGAATAVLVMLSGVALGGPRLAARVRNNRARQAEQVQQIADDLVDRIGGSESELARHVSSGDPTLLLDPFVLDLPDPREVSSEKRRVRS